MASKKRKATTTTTTILPKKHRPDDGKIEDSGGKCDFPIGDLPVEIMATIVSFIPIEQWPTVESVSRHFQKGVFGAWRNKRDLCLRDLTDPTALRSKSAFDRRKILYSILEIVKNRSPMLQSISEFGVYMKTQNAHSFGILAQFGHLKALNLSDCLVPMKYFTRFLATSASRGILEELHLVGCFRITGGKPRDIQRYLQYDELLGNAFMNEPNRPPLRLKSLTYGENYSLDGEFMSVVDVSLLEYFHLDDDDISDSCLVEFLGRCERLAELHLTFIDSWFTDTHVLDALAFLPSTNLCKLEIRSTINYFPTSNGHLYASLTEVGRRQTRLTTLTLINFELDVGVIKAMPEHFKRLEEFNLTVNCCDADTLVYLVSHLGGLKKLGFYSRSLYPCAQINARVLEAIGLHQRGLVSLRLEEPGIAANDAFVLKDLIHLKELIIPGKFSDSKLLVVLANAFGTQLERLELGSSSVTNVGMTAIMSKLSNLRHLRLVDTQIEDSTLRAIASSLPHLTTLNLAHCRSITVAGVQAVIDGCKRLVELNLNFTVRPTALNYNRRVLRCHW